MADANRRLAKHSTLGTNYEASGNQVWARDTRSWEARITAWVQTDSAYDVGIFSLYASVILFGFSMVSGIDMVEHIKANYYTNAFGSVAMIISVVIFTFYSMVAKPWFPWEAPIGLEKEGAKDLDYEDRGTFFIGEVLQPDAPQKDKAVVCFSKAKLVTHFFLFGSTGAGKTESIMSMGLNMLLIGSGFQMTDAKAQDKTLFAGMTLLRRFGREDDLYVINFIMGNRDNAGFRCPYNRDTHTFNPAVYGAGSSLAELFISLMPESGGDNAVFQQRAEAFIKAAFRVLVFLRNRGDITASINTISVKMNALETVIDMSIDKTVDSVTKSALCKYIESLPGMSTAVIEKYKETKKLPQGDHYKQHGFISMQLMSALSLFADDYGHIFNVDSADIDTYDTVINKRVLFTLIPALEKSGSSVQTLGKVVIAANKQMLAGLSGDGTLVGDARESFFPDPTEDILPYLSIQDEKAYYMVDQESVIPGQARSLNFSILYASQDYKKLSAENEAEASNMMQNTTTKFCLRQEDQETLDVISARVSEAWVSKASSSEFNSMGAYNDTGAATYEKMSRLNILDFADLKAGQGVITHGDEACWVQVMYAFAGLKKITKYTFDFPRFIPGVIINDKVATEEVRRKGLINKSRKVLIEGIKNDGEMFKESMEEIKDNPLKLREQLSDNSKELQEKGMRVGIDVAFLYSIFKAPEVKMSNRAADLIRDEGLPSTAGMGMGLDSESDNDFGVDLKGAPDLASRRRRRRNRDRAAELMDNIDRASETCRPATRPSSEKRRSRNAALNALIDEPERTLKEYPSSPAPKKDRRKAQDVINRLMGGGKRNE